MEQRPLGRTGIDVSVLGLGTVKLGRTEQLRYPSPFELPSDEEARALLERASALGINLIDTAPAYGSSEARLGRLLAGQRERWVLCSKVGEHFEAGRSTFDFRPEAVRASVENSLRALATDVLDVVLLHSSGDDVRILEESGALEALKDLKARGHVRAVGISHKSEAGGRRALELGCDVLMTTLSFEEPELGGLIGEAGDIGCGVLVKKALASGHAGLDSLRWAAQQPGVSAVVVGTLSPAHLEANARALQSS